MAEVMGGEDTTNDEYDSVSCSSTTSDHEELPVQPQTRAFFSREPFHNLMGTVDICVP
jgi:hypothetical protein